MKTRVYVKRPLKVRAFQFTMGGKLPNWILKLASVAYHEGWMDIFTEEGLVTVRDGDFVIQNMRGEISTCKPYLFEETYEYVAEDPNEHE